MFMIIVMIMIMIIITLIIMRMIMELIKVITLMMIKIYSGQKQLIRFTFSVRRYNKYIVERHSFLVGPIQYLINHFTNKSKEEKKKSRKLYNNNDKKRAKKNKDFALMRLYASLTSSCLRW